MILRIPDTDTPHIRSGAPPPDFLPFVSVSQYLILTLTISRLRKRLLTYPRHPVPTITKLRGSPMRPGSHLRPWDTTRN